ncbi:cell division protein ZapE [Meinhardsimonia xiamenensis]|uniref:Cell division protein ZapE n=1 Tax=Meinhardsimonia xiamenensis TaxID=990712 RepID=A0A1G9DUY3_9RHOB|nr:cell division protein ZapE [Meinhardsimonia xiamenensis]PRX31189.1 cell division protein ZapE [Meinhardsimonia xiamenensis]SDK67669.1 cell division protein ZapE [Meinhardsimonia xiamenensis]
MAGRMQEAYDALVAEGRIRPDPAQHAVLPLFEALAERLEAAPAQGRGRLGGLFRRARPEPAPKGIYLWGDVGRGKSMLMDLFMERVGIAEKRRVHFHAFMQEVHEGINAARARGEADAVRPVADRVARELRLLCLDEMQITDIADAMIVGRFFERLFDQGVAVVTTSNRPPEDLYKNGLNRQLFLPFIALLRERMEVVKLDSPTDYRQHRLAAEDTWFTPADAAARARIDALWEDLTGGASAPLVLKVKGREVVIPAFGNGVARASFWELCGQPLGPADYLALAEAVRVLILEEVPRLSAANYNEARRFVTLIDTLYEARVHLIVSAADVPERLYVEGEGSFEFARTASRLREMQSAGWGG